jgi:hypothetical protein
MRLLKSRAHAEEALAPLVTEGYEIAFHIDRDYTEKKKKGIFDSEADNANYLKLTNEWWRKVHDELLDIFPTQMEMLAMYHEPTGGPNIISAGTDQTWFNRFHRMRSFARKLERILKEDLPVYTDLPQGEQLFIEDIDSFRTVRDVNPQQISKYLKNGRIEAAEDDIQLNLEKMIGESFHKKDHGGEENDLYTTLLTVNGRRVPTAFMLKGRGLTKNEMTIADCGKNGDQLVRLMQSPAELFIVQFVGNVSENVVKDIQGKIRERNLQGRPALFCIINGTDTARLMFASGDLPARR